MDGGYERQSAKCESQMGEKNLGAPARRKWAAVILFVERS